MSMESYFAHLSPEEPTPTDEVKQIDELLDVHIAIAIEINYKEDDEIPPLSFRVDDDRIVYVEGKKEATTAIVAFYKKTIEEKDLRWQEYQTRTEYQNAEIAVDAAWAEKMKEKDKEIDRLKKEGLEWERQRSILSSVLQEKDQKIDKIYQQIDQLYNATSPKSNL